MNPRAVGVPGPAPARPLAGRGLPAVAVVGNEDGAHHTSAEIVRGPGCGRGWHDDAVTTTEPTAARRVLVRRLTPADWPRVREIYLEGIATGDATFETDAPPWDAWDAAHTADHRFVAEADGVVVGWVACSPTSDRCVYAGVLELSVYVAAAARGRGVGSALLRALVASTEAAGVWTLQTGIFPENTASVALHTRHGFRVVGRRERLGRMAGAWRDVLLLERRSPVL